MTQEQFDRLIQYIISNGDLPAMVCEKTYEHAWGQGMWPVREDVLKTVIKYSAKR